VLERCCRAFHPEVESVPLISSGAARATAASIGKPMHVDSAELTACFEKVSEMGDPTGADEFLSGPTTTLDASIEQRKCQAV
jgi:hypothetical protein